MKIIIYSAKEYEKPFVTEANRGKHRITFVPDSLSLETVEKAKGHDAVCCFVMDCLNQAVLLNLAKLGIRLVALRSAGYDHVDLLAAKEQGILVVHVPDYSPEAVAEFAVALILSLNRKILVSYQQGLKHNFSLDGLMGFNLCGKKIGIVGTGNIGLAFARIMLGFGCQVFAYDPVVNESGKKLGVEYVSLEQLLSESDIVSLHCPLNESTHHLINENALYRMKKGAMLINTGRGGLVDTETLIQVLESGHLGFAGLDVYEKEAGLFFIDHQNEIIKDELFLKLQAMPNVLITPHQAFLTKEAVANIASTTIANINAFEQGAPINIV